MNRKQALRNLQDIAMVLEARDVQFWLTDGTLLGLVRDNHLLPHDTDTDMGLWSDSFDPDVLIDLVNRGFIIERFFGVPADGFEITLKRKSIHTDLFFFYSFEACVYHSAYFRLDPRHGDAERLDYRYRTINIGTRSFRGQVWNVPEPVEFYLEQKYGCDWRSKRVDWDYALSPPNVVHTGQRIAYSSSSPSLQQVLSLFDKTE